MNVLRDSLGDLATKMPAGAGVLFDALKDAAAAELDGEHAREQAILALPAAVDLPQIARDIAHGTALSVRDAQTVLEIVAADRRGAPPSVDANGKPHTSMPATPGGTKGSPSR